MHGVDYCWRPGNLPPDMLLRAIEEGTLLDAHNAIFERAIWTNVMSALHGWPLVPMDQWRCTQATCAHYALPLGLDQATKILRLPHQKDMALQKEVEKCFKPRKPTKKDPHSYWHESPELLNKMGEYCRLDVLAEESLRERLGELPEEELRLWQLDQRMNDRGVRIDVQAVNAGISMVQEVSNEVAAEMIALTGFQPGQRDRLIEWAEFYGTYIPDMQKETLDRLLEGDHDPSVLKMLRLKRRAGKASNHKLAAMRRSVCSDGRCRGLMQYHGATTGRNTGRLFQPLNMPRPQGVFEDFQEEDVVAFIEALKTRDRAFVELAYGDLLEATSYMLRGMITVADGRAMVAGDWSGIEARILAALAGEKWKIKAFREADAGTGRNLYCVAADKVFGYHVESKKTHPMEYAVGKVCELAFGYQGGVGAWRNFDSSDRHTDEAVEGYKKAWREEHPGVKQLWKDMESAAIRSVYRRCPTSVGPIEFRLEDEWLTMRLPSGRKLWYFHPNIRVSKTPWGTDCLKLSYWQYRDGRWQCRDSYGGMLVENAVQAMSRDILTPAMFKAEEYKHPLILTIYDELVAEPLERDADSDLLRQIMCDVDPWVTELDIPIAADTWKGTRFRK